MKYYLDAYGRPRDWPSGRSLRRDSIHPTSSVRVYSKAEAEAIGAEAGEPVSFAKHPGSSIVTGAAHIPPPRLVTGLEPSDQLASVAGRKDPASPPPDPGPTPSVPPSEGGDTFPDEPVEDFDDGADDDGPPTKPEPIPRVVGEDELDIWCSLVEPIILRVGTPRDAEIVPLDDYERLRIRSAVEKFAARRIPDIMSKYPDVVAIAAATYLVGARRGKWGAGRYASPPPKPARVPQDDAEPSASSSATMQ